MFHLKEMFYQIIISILCLVSFTISALPECQNGETCPIGGIWSEWSTTESCPTECGSCFQLYYKRSCLSAKSNCNCIGNTSRYLPCNTVACKYPAQRTCCIPYVPLVINRTSQCGPFPKDPSSANNSPCCPKNGMWSEWSGFTRGTDGWVQTRECVSESAGCPCVGDSSKSQTACPCPAMKSDAEVASECAGGLAWMKNSYTTNDATCERTASFVDSNDDEKACSPYTTYKPYDFAPRVVFTTSTGACPDDRPWDCEARKQSSQNGRHLSITFSCDVDKLLWIYDYTGTAVTGFVQIEFP